MALNLFWFMITKFSEFIRLVASKIDNWVENNITDTKTKKAFPNLASCSYDKGFHSPENQEKLKKGTNGYLGKVRSNFLGTEFYLYDTGENPGKAK